MSNSIIKTRAFSQLQEMKQWGFKLRRMLGCKFKRSKAQISEWLMSHASLFTFGPNHFAELKIFWTCFFYFLFALSCELCAFPWFYQWLLFTTVIRAFFSWIDFFFRTENSWLLSVNLFVVENLSVHSFRVFVGFFKRRIL